jgi:hypothetical protein
MIANHSTICRFGCGSWRARPTLAAAYQLALAALDGRAYLFHLACTSRCTRPRTSCPRAAKGVQFGAGYISDKAVVARMLAEKATPQETRDAGPRTVHGRNTAPSSASWKVLTLPAFCFSPLQR